MLARPLVVGFLMDPLERVHVHHDTTFALMLEAQRRGHEVRSFEQADLFFKGAESHARMRTVSVRRQQGEHFQVLDHRDAPLAELDVLFLRKDPPVDVEFVHATQLVELAGGRPFFINSPAGLRDANEKLLALRYPELIPPTLISRDPFRIRAFLDEVGGDAVLKPVDGFGGQSVLRVRQADPNLSSMIEIMTQAGKLAAVAQAYLPASRAGDKRIIVLDGEPLGAVLRVPREGDVRANMAAGGAPVKTELTPRDREICARLAPELRARGLYFVGVDVIGDRLTEINVTSPTGIAEIDALDGARLEERVLEFAEQRAAGAGSQTNRLRT